MRRFEFPVDLSHAKAVNQTLADVRRLRWSGIFVALVCAAGAVGLFLVGAGWSYIVAAVLAVAAVASAWVALWAPHKVGTIEQLYHDSPLVPAVVAAKRARGLTLLALVDIAKPETSSRHFALVTRNVEAVPGHRIAIGERVPCVAVLSDRTTRNTSGMWQMVGPMPIAWGTRDQKVIADAVARIPDVEWRVLKDKLKMVDEVDATDERRLELSSKELPPELR
ncbi:DUF3239 domain-containing protein [Rhodococcus sp. NPDC047139]|uniref:DUF3239 domain-containing protein n=1 Tax=Rhodococcus sp. NPDC047139 TaxID=3155141 RepID=UPI0033F5F7A4